MSDTFTVVNPATAAAITEVPLASIARIRVNPMWPAAPNNPIRVI